MTKAGKPKTDSSTRLPCSLQAAEIKPKVRLLPPRLAVNLCPKFTELAQDISAHHSDPEEAIKTVRNWFGKSRRNVLIPSGSKLAERYRKFQDNLPIVCQSLKLTVAELTFLDFQNIVVEWLRENPW